MEEINLDLNNLFNLSYNFEGLKILLKSIAKKQDGMMEKIKELERRPINNFQKYDEKEIQINNKNKEEKIIHILKDDKENNNNNFLIIDLKSRVSNLENEYKKLRNFIPQYQESKTLNDILDEHNNNLNDLNDNIKLMKENMKNMEETVQSVKLKVMDFSIFEALKDKNISADLDVAELMIKSLENKVNEKFKFHDDKIKKDESDFIKIKNFLDNLNNSFNSQSRNLTYIKEELSQESQNIEQLRANVSEGILKNKELIGKLREKSNSLFKDHSSSISNLKEKILTLEQNIQKLSENIESNNKKEKEIDLSVIEQEYTKKDEFMIFKENIVKKCSHLEKKIKEINEKIKTEELEEKIFKINKEIQNKKPDEKEFYTLNEQVQTHQDFIDSYKIENTNIQADLKKLKDTLNLVNRKCEDLILQNLMSAKMSEDSKDSKARQNLILAKLEEYLQSSVFKEFLTDYIREKDKIKKDIDNYKLFKEEIIETLKKSASIQDLKNLESYLEDLFDEFKNKMLKICPRKSEINKSIKNIKKKKKNVYEFMKKDEKNENWLLAKKPMGGFACASCESYLGDLKENDEKVFWNQLPEYGSTMTDFNVNKIGNGFSRILNLVNINKDKDDKEKNVATKTINSVNNDNKNNKESKENNGKDILNILKDNGLNKKKNIFRNINLENNLFTMPSYDEIRNGLKTQRLKKVNLDGNNFDTKSKNNEINQNLPPITTRNDELIDIYEEGKEQKDAPKLIKIIKKKK